MSKTSFWKVNSYPPTRGIFCYLFCYFCFLFVCYFLLFVLFYFFIYLFYFLFFFFPAIPVHTKGPVFSQCDLCALNYNNLYASPISGEAYRDRRLTTNFELWVEIFCVPTCFHMRIPKPCLSVCLSVCPHPEKRYHHSFVNISPTLVIDTSMERSSRVLRHGNPKIWFFFKKVRNSNFNFRRRAEITLASSISALH